MAAISRNIGRLLTKRVVVEIPFGDSQGPRRKRGLQLNPKRGYVIAIYHSPNEISCTALNTAYGIVRESNKSLQLKELSQKRRIAAITSFLDQFRSQIPRSAGPCMALSVVDPGIIDETTGIVKMCSVLDDWANVPLGAILEKKYKLPVLVLSSNLVMIRTIDRLEIKNQVPNLLYIEYHSGISCGIKLNGQYLTGRLHLAGEFGHVKVTERSVPCRCGAMGCLEAVAALPSLAKRLRDLQNEIPSDSTSLQPHQDGLAVLTAAAKGDRLATRVVQEAFTYLGNAVGGLVNLLAPDKVVFDHRIGLAGADAFNHLRQAARQSMLPAHLDHTEISVSALQQPITALGGAVTLLDTLFDY
jgi:predicted NBD/HSP70 family sugar kinase